MTQHFILQRQFSLQAEQPPPPDNMLIWSACINFFNFKKFLGNCCVENKTLFTLVFLHLD